MGCKIIEPFSDGKNNRNLIGITGEVLNRILFGDVSDEAFSAIQFQWNFCSFSQPTPATAKGSYNCNINSVIKTPIETLCSKHRIKEKDKERKS